MQMCTDCQRAAPRQRPRPTTEARRRWRASGAGPVGRARTITNQAYKTRQKSEIETCGGAIEAHGRVAWCQFRGQPRAVRREQPSLEGRSQQSGSYRSGQRPPLRARLGRRMSGTRSRRPGEINVHFRGERQQSSQMRCWNEVVTECARSAFAAKERWFKSAVKEGSPSVRRRSQNDASPIAHAELLSVHLSAHALPNTQVHHLLHNVV